MNSNVFHDSREAGLMDPSHADDKFGMDQAETNMVKLVDGKLVSTANTESIAPDSLQDHYTNDEEQGLNTPERMAHDRMDAKSEFNLASQADVPENQDPTSEMIPPSIPDPNNPVPAAPETPTPPTPGPVSPEIPELPSTPQPANPEITDPTQPGRSHEVNNS
ncbi:hypothetical protein [Tellurirhabdus bombi]|uniref:hypothetical protein n=1 Tax=Tellurirhabdus bombi TaxID=2907205 RepID=UPI001F2E92ED|nr:hypothetical protein [Tellurirhabdus bombi]